MELGHRLGAQCLVLDGQLRRRSQSAGKLRLVHECRIVNHERERVVAAGDPGDRAAGARRIGGSAVGVDQPARAAPRIEHVDSRVAEGYGKRVAQHAWPRRVPQVSGQASQTRACARYAHEAPGEPEREQGVRDRAGQEDRGEPGPVRILERRSQERDRVGGLGRADQERRAENGEQRAPGPVARSSRRQAKATRPSAIASSDQSNRSPSALAIPASAWTRNELSVQLRQQYRSSSGSRNAARPTVRRATRAYAATTATRAVRERTRPSGTASARWRTQHERERSDQRPEAPEEGLGVLGALTIRSNHARPASMRARRGGGSEAVWRRARPPGPPKAGREVGRPCGGKGVG